MKIHLSHSNHQAAEAQKHLWNVQAMLKVFDGYFWLILFIRNMKTKARIPSKLKSTLYVLETQLHLDDALRTQEDLKER